MSFIHSLSRTLRTTSLVVLDNTTSLVNRGNRLSNSIIELNTTINTYTPTIRSYCTYNHELNINKSLLIASSLINNNNNNKNINSRYYSSSNNKETTQEQTPNQEETDEKELLRRLFNKDQDAAKPKQSIFITTETTPNPDSLKFKTGVDVMSGFNQEGDASPNKTVDFPDFKSAQISPLAHQLFKLDGVNRVFFGPDFISVNKFPESDWSILKPQIYGTIVNFYNSGEPLLLEKPVNENSDTMILPEDDDVVAMIKELIETRIRPTLLDDGGNLQYLGFRDGIVMVKLQGTCSSCSSSQATLKKGIERMLMHWISEVRGILAVTDDELENLNMDYFNKVDQQLEKKE